MSRGKAVSVTGAVYDRLSAYAKGRKVTMRKVVDNLVNNYLDKLEIGGPAEDWLHFDTVPVKRRLPDDGYPPLLTPGDDGDD